MPGHRIALVLILLLAAALRWHDLGRKSLWIDELTIGSAAQSPLRDFLAHIRADAAAAPLDYLGVRFFMSILGHGTIATRFWAFAVGCAAISAIYLVGSRLLASRRVGLVAALLLAFSAFHIYYSQEARFYSLTVLVALLNLYFFDRALQQRRRRDWLFFGGIATLALYTHYFLALLLPIEAAFIAGYWSWRWASTRFRRDILRDGLQQVGLCAGAMLGAVLLFAPWLLMVTADQLQIASGPDLPPLDFTQVQGAFIHLLALPPGGAPERVLAFSVVGLAALGLLLSLRAGRAQSLILLAAIVLAVPAAWAADRFGHYFFAERQVIFILPLVYVLAAAGITFSGMAAGKWVTRLDLLHKHAGEHRGWVRRAASSLGTPSAALALGILWGLFNWGSIEKVYADRWQTKEDWRGAAAFIASSDCLGGRYYTNVSAHYQYGIAYYQPRLESQTRFLHGTLGHWERSLPAAVSVLDFDSRDWIVLLSFAAGGDAAGLVHATLTQQGWSYREFPDQRLRVYYRATRPECLPGTASGPTPASSRRSDPISAGPQPR